MPQHHCDHECNGHSSLNDSEDLGVLYSLFSKIDLGKLECLNEAEEGSGKTVFKPWEERMDMEKVMNELLKLWRIMMVVIVFCSLSKAIATRSCSSRFRKTALLTPKFSCETHRAFTFSLGLLATSS